MANSWTGAVSYFVCRRLGALGYRDSPLEKMAYDAEAAFTANEIFNAEEMVARKLS